MTFNHISVMLEEAVGYLNCEPGKTIADCTLGGCGHSKAILEKILPNGRLIGIDRDKDSIFHARQILKPYCSNVELFHANYIDLPDILTRLNIKAVDGILLDLGISFHQIESSGRGFSFNKEEPLDMRMNIDSKMTAKDIVQNYDQKQLADIFKKYGEEHWADLIAQKIVNTRTRQDITTSKQLAQIITSAIPRKVVFKKKIHPATKVFMALRIAVNRELEQLEQFLNFAMNYLNPKGRLCVISFHSLEDRLVKQKMVEYEARCVCPPDFPKCVCNQKAIARRVNRKVITPQQKEILDNPLSRSAKLRIAERL